MYAIQPPLEPPVYEDRYALIKEMTIENICKDILRRGDRTLYQDIFDYILEYVEDNLEKFLPEQEIV